MPCEDCVWFKVTAAYYHQAISDEHLMLRLLEEHAEIQHQWSHLVALPFRGLRIWCGKDCLADYHGDPQHIHDKFSISI
jgi:hypothetical protein